ncbi:hypothetical protein VTI28DRAFT_3205 [Corynascus sepedonium]
MFFVDFRPPNYLTSIASIEIEDFDPRKAFLTMEVKVLPVPMLPATGKVMPQFPIRLAPETRAKLQQEEAKWDASADHCTLWRLSKALPTPIAVRQIVADIVEHALESHGRATELAELSSEFLKADYISLRTEEIIN